MQNDRRTIKPLNFLIFTLKNYTDSVFRNECVEMCQVTNIDSCNFQLIFYALGALRLWLNNFDQSSISVFLEFSINTRTYKMSNDIITVSLGLWLFTFINIVPPFDGCLCRSYLFVFHYFVKTWPLWSLINN